MNERHDRQSYYSEFLPVFYSFSLGGVAGAIGSMSVSVNKFSLVSFIVTMAIGLPAGALFCRVLIKLFPVQIDRQGIKSYNFWGVYRYVRWAEIASVKPYNILNLSYLQVNSINKTQIYIPLFLSKMNSFRQQVRSFVNSEHPIVRFMK